MTESSAVTFSVCPTCGEQMRGDCDTCCRCGGPVDGAGAAQRATLPGSAPGTTPSPVVIENAPAAGEQSTERVQDELGLKFEEESLEEDDWHASGPDPLIGYVVAGRYRILECIGRGGMGVVYKVEHTEIGKLLALKLLAGELCREREVVRRFKREALLASRLSHPNSVQVFDFGVSDGLTFIVMELVTGQDLARIIRSGGPMPFDRMCRIVLQVCSSLAEAHGMGIVHRDLKPENILVSRTKEGADLAKVLDFGLAKLRESPELNEVTGHGTIVGTPFYMAPEQIMGKPIDGRADIYALGAVMYKALTGETLFDGSSPMAVFTQHLNSPPIPMRERNPRISIPDSVDDVVMRALAKSPLDRFQRIEDLRAALVEILGGIGQSSVEMLLNSAQLQAMQAEALAAAHHDASQASRTGMGRTMMRKAEIATRDEVEAFKRKLARQRRYGTAVAVSLALIASAGGMRAYQRATASPGFQGFELEPDNQATEATDVPFGVEVQGQLGKRISPEQGDRDFFRVVIPPGANTISIDARPLPNMALCVWAYRSGEPNPVARLCPGRPALPLRVPALRIDPDTYFFAVMQDREPYGAPSPPFVLENVSDSYALRVAAAAPDPAFEIEPNDARQVAIPVEPGNGVRGTLAWTEDEDVACVAPSVTGRVRWIVEDAVDRPRDRGAVLQVTPSNGPRPGVAIRVHRAGQTGKPSATDVAGPWRSEPFDPNAGSDPACITLRLTLDPWAGDNAPLTPPVSGEHWWIRVEPVP